MERWQEAGSLRGYLGLRALPQKIDFETGLEWYRAAREHLDEGKALALTRRIAEGELPATEISEEVGRLKRWREDSDFSSRATHMSRLEKAGLSDAVERIRAVEKGNTSTARDTLVHLEENSPEELDSLLSQMEAAGYKNSPEVRALRAQGIHETAGEWEFGLGWLPGSAALVQADAETQAAAKLFMAQDIRDKDENKYYRDAILRATDAVDFLKSNKHPEQTLEEATKLYVRLLKFQDKTLNRRQVQELYSKFRALEKPESVERAVTILEGWSSFSEGVAAIKVLDELDGPLLEKMELANELYQTEKANDSGLFDSIHETQAVYESGGSAKLMSTMLKKWGYKKTMKILPRYQTMSLHLSEGESLKLIEGLSEEALGNCLDHLTWVPPDQRGDALRALPKLLEARDQKKREGWKTASQFRFLMEVAPSFQDWGVTVDTYASLLKQLSPEDAQRSLRQLANQNGPEVALSETAKFAEWVAVAGSERGLEIWRETRRPSADTQEERDRLMDRLLELEAGNSSQTRDALVQYRALRSRAGEGEKLSQVAAPLLEALETLGHEKTLVLSQLLSVDADLVAGTELLASVSDQADALPLWRDVTKAHSEVDFEGRVKAAQKFLELEYGGDDNKHKTAAHQARLDYAVVGPKPEDVELFASVFELANNMNLKGERSRRVFARIQQEPEPERAAALETFKRLDEKLSFGAATDIFAQIPVGSIAEFEEFRSLESGNDAGNHDALEQTLAAQEMDSDSRESLQRFLKTNGRGSSRQARAMLDVLDHLELPQLKTVLAGQKADTVDELLSILTRLRPRDRGAATEALEQLVELQSEKGFKAKLDTAFTKVEQWRTCLGGWSNTAKLVGQLATQQEKLEEPLATVAEHFGVDQQRNEALGALVGLGIKDPVALLDRHSHNYSGVKALAATSKSKNLAQNLRLSERCSLPGETTPQAAQRLSQLLQAQSAGELSSGAQEAFQWTSAFLREHPGTDMAGLQLRLLTLLTEGGDWNEARVELTNAASSSFEAEEDSYRFGDFLLPVGD